MVKSKVKFFNDSSNEDDKNQSFYIDKIVNYLQNKYRHKDMPLAYIHTFGCQQNVNDGEKIKGMIALMGYGFTDSAENADFVLFNTCAVRENAEDRVFGNIGALKRYKTANRNMIIAVCGCMTQQKHIQEKIKKTYHHVNIVFGTHSLHKLPEIIHQAINTDKRIFDVESEESEIIESIPIVRQSKIKAWVPISYGCDHFCTYCVVPYVRGKEKSRTPENILDEIRGIVSTGVKEIGLLGQNVNSYGKGVSPKINFSELLKRVNDIEGDFRIRFMSPHPKDANEDMFDTIANCEKVCNSIHLPFQSGNDKILKKMNRKYTADEYLNLVNYGKKIIPNITFTTDIIVGFPGETYEKFLDTIKILKQVKFASVYSFIYSKRIGTPAEKMEDLIPKKEKSDWLREMLRYQEDITLDLNKSFVGKTVNVLVDEIGKQQDGFISGRCDENILVEFPGAKSLIGNFVKVEIKDYMKCVLIGKKID